MSVYFERLHTTVEMKRHLFTVYDINVKRDVATRLQIPLKLGYAFTVHKAQGLTLDCVEVDFRNMNCPGQIGVAVGRAVKTDGLRVINFDKCYMNKQPELLEFFYKSDSALMRKDLECCTQSCHCCES